LRDDDDESDPLDEADGVLVYSSEGQKEEIDNEEEEKIDPRWEALKKLRGE
jgi:hypothetical protein